MKRLYEMARVDLLSLLKDVRNNPEKYPVDYEERILRKIKEIKGSESSKEEKPAKTKDEKLSKAELNKQLKKITNTYNEADPEKREDFELLVTKALKKLGLNVTQIDGESLIQILQAAQKGQLKMEHLHLILHSEMIVEEMTKHSYLLD